MLRNTTIAVVLAAAVALTAMGTARAAEQALVDAYAPTGTLRAVINVGNAVLARRLEGGGAAGISVDLADELGRRLGLPVERVVVPSAGQAVELVRSGKADVGFFAVDPQRGEGIAFSPPYLLIEGAYLVRQDSPLARNEEVDRPGTRIAVGLGSAYDLFLSREIKQATLVRVPTSPMVVTAFLEQGSDVAAGVRQQLEADMQTHPGLRLLPGRFMVIHQAMGIARNRPAMASEHLGRFVEEMKSSGMVSAAVARHGVDGVSVAPPGQASRQ